MAVDTFQLSSSLLAEASYDDEEQTLTLVFQNGRSYDYENVPPNLVQELKQATSPGRFWNFYLKGRY